MRFTQSPIKRNLRLKEMKMNKVIGTHKGRKAEKWSDGTVFIFTGISWIREVGQEHFFIADQK